MKKVTSVLLATIIIISVTFGISATAYGYSAHSRLEVIDWLKDVKLGHKAGRGQCVDLIKDYYTFMGVTALNGSACTYATNELPQGWDRIEYYEGFVAQPGDIAIWTYLTSEDGHVAIVENADANSMNVFDQNGSTRPAHIVKTAKYYYKSSKEKVAFFGVIRPDFIPMRIDNYQVNELSPSRIKLSYKICNPNKLGIEKQKLSYKKQGDSIWKSITKTYDTKIKKNINCSAQFKNLSENTTYNLRIGVYVNGGWKYFFKTSFTTPQAISILNASAKSVRVKYSDGSVFSTSALIPVYLDGNQLNYKSDYTVYPTSVKDIGRYTITITGTDWFRDSITRAITIYPKTPTITKVSYNNIDGRIHLSWKRVADCSYQQVAISKTSNFTSATTYVFKVAQSKQAASIYKVKFGNEQTNVKKGSKYYIRMRAYKEVNGEKIYGDWGKARSIVCK